MHEPVHGYDTVLLMLFNSNATSITIAATTGFYMIALYMQGNLYGYVQKRVYAFQCVFHSLQSWSSSSLYVLINL